MKPVWAGTGSDQWYAGYIIRTSHGGGKAGRGKNRTMTLQATLPFPAGYLLKKQAKFIVGNHKSYDTALAKIVKWIDDNPCCYPNPITR